MTIFVVIFPSETQKRVRVNNGRLFTASSVDNFKMSLYFVLCLERYIALCFTVIVWAQKVRLVKVDF